MYAFVSMPFFEKPNLVDGSGDLIDFDAVYEDLIEPAVRAAGYAVDRCDRLEDPRSNIPLDMFQRLLISDLVIADITIDNPNVWYELGARHALRTGGVIMLACRDRIPFNITTEKIEKYHLKGGRPDPAFLEDDRSRLTKRALQAAAETIRVRSSPIYHLLKNLEEPEWKRLRVNEADGFWNGYDRWTQRLTEAKDKNRAGDIMVLAEDPPAMGFQLEARRAAGKALISLRSYELAIDQFQRALDIDDFDLVSMQQQALAHNRLGERNKARTLLEDTLSKQRQDPRLQAIGLLATDHEAETLGNLGRIAKDDWLERWKDAESVEEAKELARRANTPLSQSIRRYREGFQICPSNHYTGVNVTTLEALRHHVGAGDPVGHDVIGAVRWAILADMMKSEGNYYAHASLLELEFTAGNLDRAEDALGRAVECAGQDLFKLASTRQQLLLFQRLGFQEDVVSGYLTELDFRLERYTPDFVPNKSVLFVGHMVDLPDRDAPRFPNIDSDIRKVRDAIAVYLDRLGANKDDLALSSGACGGDLLFADEALKRGMKLHLYLPHHRVEFIEHSVAFGGDLWLSLFESVWDRAEERLDLQYDLGPPIAAKGKGLPDDYVRNNLRLYYNTVAWGKDKANIVTLYDGGPSGGAGGTADMIEMVKRHGGHMTNIDLKQVLAS